MNYMFFLTRRATNRLRFILSSLSDTVGLKLSIAVIAYKGDFIQVRVSSPMRFSRRKELLFEEAEYAHND